MSIRHHLWLTIMNYSDDGQQSRHWGSCGSDPCVIPGVAIIPSTLCHVFQHLPPSVISVKNADLTIRVGSLSGLTQKALDSMAQWGQESSQGLNGAKAIDVVNQCQETGQHSCSTISNDIWTTDQQSRHLKPARSADIIWLVLVCPHQVHGQVRESAIALLLIEAGM